MEKNKDTDIFLVLSTPYESRYLNFCKLELIFLQ